MSDTIEKEVPSSLAPRGMAHIPGGVFRMGSDRHYPEEAPSHLVKVDGFWIDRTPVTNREFRKFVNATALAFFPYLLLRGPIARIARWRLDAASAESQ